MFSEILILYLAFTALCLIMTSTTKPIPLKCICEKHIKGACHMKVVSIIQEPFLMDNKLQGSSGHQL